MKFEYGAYHSDSGPPCYRCGGTIFQYSPSMGRSGIINTFCHTCHADDYFFIDDNGAEVTATLLSRRHRVARGFPAQVK